MKKIYFFMLLMTCALSSLMAGLPSGFPGSFIVLRPIQNVFRPHPGTIPLTIDEPTFTASLLDDELIITSESATGAVEIVIEGKESVVYSNLVSMAPGAEVTVSLTNFAEGEYTLYIIIGDMTLEGEFEI